MRVSWTRGSGIAALAAMAVLLQGADAVRAQYNQYGYSNPPQQQQNPAAYSAQQPWQSFAPQASGQPYAAPTQPASRYAQTPPYTAMAYSAMEHHGEGHQNYTEQVPAQVPAAGCPTGNCQGQAPAPAPAYQGSYSGCDGGCYNSYNTFNGGQSYCQCAGQHAGVGCLDGACGGCRPQWFGGVYGLLMDRDRGPYVPISFSTPTPGAPGYYPADGEVNLEVRDADIDYQAGVEFRLGAYMGGGRGAGGCGYGGCDAYGCGAGSCGCGPTHGWEVVYWGLFEESATSFVTDTTVDANRLYGMIDFRGWEYSPTGLVADYRPVNDYYDYGPPTEDRTAPYDVEVRQFSVRNTFSMQNIEANLLRIPALSSGCSGAGACGMGGSACGMGGCGAGGCDGCCSMGGCGGCGASLPRYSVTTVLGARFLRMDDDFWFRTDFERMDTNVQSFLAYNVQTDNTLYGGQLGCRGTYRCGSSGRLALHCASNVGLYGNHIEVAQWMDAPTAGTVRHANNGNDSTYVENDKDDVSILGELRLGASYRYSCNCRVYGGWRVMGVTGVALTTDQIPPSFNSPAQVGWIHSNGSLLIHGLQTGIEYNY